MSDKAFVCRCEDVTLDDVMHAVSLGYGDIEEVKRFTGLGTGPCEGKECMALCARLLAEHGGAPEAARPFTARPPVHPVSLGMLAGSVIERAPPPAGNATPGAPGGRDDR